jgi:hypothetical protein
MAGAGAIERSLFEPATGTMAIPASVDLML